MKDKRQQVRELLKEQSEIERFEFLLKKDTLHFDIREHYGNNSGSWNIPRRYNAIFLAAYDKVKEDIQKQLNDFGL